jgi:hypothetical protein
VSGKNNEKKIMTTKKPNFVAEKLGSAIYIAILCSFGTATGCYDVGELDTYYATANNNIEGTEESKKDTSEKDTHSDNDESGTDSHGDTNDTDTFSDDGNKPDRNRCLALDGEGDYVRTRQNDGLAVSGEWTMEAWIWYREDGTGLHPILRGADESTSISSYFMYTEYDDLGGSKPMAGFGYQSSKFQELQGPGLLPEREWIHMAFVHDTDEIRYYLNGKTVASEETMLDARPVADDVIIGAILHPRKTGYHNGYIDDVRVSSVVRYDENFTPKHRYGLDEDTIVLWNFDIDYGDDYTMDAREIFVSNFIDDAHIVDFQSDFD